MSRERAQERQRTQKRYPKIRYVLPPYQKADASDFVGSARVLDIDKPKGNSETVFQAEKNPHN
ncbi:MAG: hypothetical protein A2684_03680 [Candidatus Levybacteria bacterium RIFCSPHIGHO2_01_FULL_36_15b]|nr:MAG: hypothetical protein A2684_03680 [Candidatus Levybacteria bacterium RIFCSPHIGHO2_01_FULL_36_15b]